MKKILFLTIWYLATNAFVGAQEIINYFEVASNIATPVTIKTNLGTFQINGGETIRGTITSLTAFDADGNWIVQNSYYKSEWDSKHTYHYRYYRFESTYNQSSSNNNKSSKSSSNNNKSNNNLERSIGQASQSITRAQSKFIDEAASMSAVPMDGYPNLQIRGGISIAYGELVGIQAELGGEGGWILGGGIGKDYIRGSDSLSWYADLGMYMGDEDNLFVMGFIFGKSILDAPNWTSGKIHSRFLLGSGMYLGWEHYFEDIPRLGIFVTGQLNLGSFDLRAGISWKLFARLPYFDFE